MITYVTPTSFSDASELTVSPLFNGPPGSANGGYLAGALALRIPGPARSAVVTLRKPPPLAEAMAVTAAPEGGIRLELGGTLIAEAGPSALAGLGTPPSVPFEEAKAAEARFRGHSRHPFPGCFVCGPARGDRDGIHLFPGLVDPASGLHACGWVPSATVTDFESGRVRPEFVWAALDCPGAWTVDLESRDVVLGRITARVDATPALGEPCVVTSRLVGQDGRKFTTVTAAYDANGALLGEAESVWIEIRPAA
jgi:hypothetical protein